MMNKHSQVPALTNPETAFHFGLLQKGRRKEYRLALLILITSSIMLAGTAFFLGTIIISSSYKLLSPLMLAIFLCVILIGAVALISSLLDLRRAARPIEVQEVEQVRQEARVELMKQAQGYIPLAYRRKAILSQIIFACFWTFFGVTFFFIPATLSPWINNILGFIFLLGATIFFLEALIIRPQQAKQLAARSAHELSHRLTLGELTEGHWPEEER